MSTGYKIAKTDDLYFLTFQIVDWVDIFTRKVYRDIIIDTLDYCIRNRGLSIYAYVIMTNHIHLIARSLDGDLSSTIRDFKRYTCKKIIEEIQNSSVESRREWLLTIFRNAILSHTRNTNYQVWTHENHAEILNTNPFIKEKLNYIHENPVRAGLVYQAEDYPYSSASVYKGEKGLLDIERIDMQWNTY